MIAINKYGIFEMYRYRHEICFLNILKTRTYNLQSIFCVWLSTVCFSCINFFSVENLLFIYVFFSYLFKFLICLHRKHVNSGIIFKYCLQTTNTYLSCLGFFSLRFTSICFYLFQFYL